MPHKINRVLGLILIAFLAIGLRALHLGLFQREMQLIEAQKPKTRTLVQKADRGCVCDRFGIPLAINRISYNAVIYYNQIAEIPHSQWKEDGEGKRVRIFPRKEYVEALSKMLGDALGEAPSRIEDLIYSKASLFPNAPFSLKTGLTEEEHYRLKGIERCWPGLYAETASERYYPLHKVGCHVLGTMGAISQRKYQGIVKELVSLQEAVESYEQGQDCTLPKGYRSFESAWDRLKELKEKAYTLSDSVGKSGIEAQFEEELRGFYGKKTFEVDPKGRFLRELAGSRSPVPGRQVVLSISAELQQYAEELLAFSEKDREGRSFGIDIADKKRKPVKQPWIKGGAIVALDPVSGELLALASFPRFDPNDFITGSDERLSRWLENETHIGSIWDGRAPLVREKPDFTEEELFLSWDLYLDMILPKESPIRSFFQRCDDLKLAIQIQEDFETVRYFSGLCPIKVMEDLAGLPQGGKALKARRQLEALLAPIVSAADKLFCIDLCRLAVDSTRFSDELIAKVGSMKLSAYWELKAKFLKCEKAAKDEARASFREKFLSWREANQKAFLAEKRQKEKENKTYAHPYLDYLDKQERELFAEEWALKRDAILLELDLPLSDLTPALEIEFLRTFRSFKDLDRPLLAATRKMGVEKDLAAAFYPEGGFGYIRSYAFQTSAPQGSLFKLVTAYEGLRQGHAPVIIDEAGKDLKAVAYSLSGVPYPRIYKGGRLPRSSNYHIGKIDMAGAIEQTSNPYFSILAGDYLSDPNDLKVAAALLGYGEKTGLDLPGEASGLLPNDLMNRTSLYSFAFGQHTLLSTPIQAAVMLSALSNGGKVLQPQIAKALTGLAPDREILSLFETKNGFAEKELQALGVPFSLFTGVQVKAPVEEVGVRGTKVRRTVPLPSTLRSHIFEGMDRSMWGAKGSANPARIRALKLYPKLFPEHLSLEHQMIGKTSTAELLYRPNLNPSSAAQMIKYTWFGALSFSPDAPARVRYDHPELTVVIFLRFGDAGREAAPLAAQMVRKWREIRKKHEK